MAFSRIPYATEQGICKRVSGIFFDEQGILIEGSRDRRRSEKAERNLAWHTDPG